MSLNRNCRLCLLWSASLLLGCAEPRTPSVAQGEPLRPEFQFQGKPIPAEAVGVLLGELADPLPSIGAIDLEGFARANARADSESAEDYFVYTCLGSSKSGTFVLRVDYHTAGTGIFGNLLLVRLETDAILEDGKERSRCLLRSVGNWALGDRSSAAVSFDGETLTIPPSEIRKEEVRVHVR